MTVNWAETSRPRATARRTAGRACSGAGPAAVGAGRVRVVLKGRAKPVRTAAFHPDGRRVLTTFDDGTGRVWDPETGRTGGTLNNQAVNAVAGYYFPNLRTLTLQLSSSFCALREPSDPPTRTRSAGRRGAPSTLPPEAPPEVFDA